MAPALGQVSLEQLADTVGRMPLAMAVIDLSSNRLTLANASFAALLMLDDGQGEGLHLPSMVPREDRGVVERVLAGVASGLIDSCEGRGSLQAPTGAIVDVLASVHPLGAAKPRSSALIVAAPARGNRRGEPWLTSLDATRVALGAVDHDWRIAEMSADAEANEYRPSHVSSSSVRARCAITSPPSTAGSGSTRSRSSWLV